LCRPIGLPALEIGLQFPERDLPVAVGIDFGEEVFGGGLLAVGRRGGGCVPWLSFIFSMPSVNSDSVTEPSPSASRLWNISSVEGGFWPWGGIRWVFDLDWRSEAMSVWPVLPMEEIMAFPVF